MVMMLCSERARKKKVFVTAGIGMVLLPCLLLGIHLVSVVCSAETDQRPDLYNTVYSCTRLEIRFEPSTLEYWFFGDDAENLLNSAEQRYLRSLERVVCDDPIRIKSFAKGDLMEEVYLGNFTGEPRTKQKTKVVGYRDDKRVISFTIVGDTLFTEQRDVYRFHGGFRNLVVLLPELRPFIERGACAGHLVRLGDLMPGDRRLDPSEWCDAVLQHALLRYNRIVRPLASSVFTCPSAPVSHYAMNPNYMPDSPRNTVCLFETTAGWNQHGGPELFTFDNHDPKGGCVLLNDGTVKFIRTKEELHALRWK
jgi:hypothetical protein